VHFVNILLLFVLNLILKAQFVEKTVSKQALFFFKEIYLTGIARKNGKT